MKQALTLLGTALAATLVLSACGERSQAEPGRLKKADAKASSGAPAEGKVYTAAGWTAGDDTSWQTQIRGRTQGQNEYARITSTHTAATDTGAPAAASPASAPAVAKVP
jgi:hypothetical protein